MVHAFPRPDGPLPRPIGAIADLARLIGADAALRLAEDRGGTILYVPNSVDTNRHLLASLIGAEALTKLVEVYAGNQIKVPVAREWRAIIYRMAGLSIDQVALELRCDRATVQRIQRDWRMREKPEKRLRANADIREPTS